MIEKNHKTIFKIGNKILIHKILLFIFLLNILIVFDSPIVKADENYEFSFEVSNNDLKVFAGENITTKIYVNQSGDSNEDILLDGSWLNGEKPLGVTVNFSKKSGAPSFIANVTFLSNSISETGIFIYNISAERKNITHSENIRIVITDLSINLSTDKENYEHYETILISGDIDTSYDFVFSDNIVIEFDYLEDDWNRSVTVSAVNNSFEYQYNISFGDPPCVGTGDQVGVWKISAKVYDENNELIKATKDINVSIPVDNGIYTPKWNSPTQGTVYNRGDSFTISVNFVEGEEDDTTVPVENATARCILPNLEIISLNEKNPGNYHNTYQIPYDSLVGRWFLSVDCIKNNSGTLNFGGSYIYVDVEPVMLNMTLIEPDYNTSKELYPGDSVDIKINLTYPDDTYVTDATVNAIFPSTNLSLNHIGKGVYVANYTVRNDDIGNWFFNISATDEYGNYGSTEQSVYVYNKTTDSSEGKEKSGFPLITASVVLISCICAIFVLRILQRRFSRQHLEDVQTEIKEIQRLQNEAVEKYYKKGSINRPTYDNLRHEYESRLDELKKEESKIKK